MNSLQRQAELSHELLSPEGNNDLTNFTESAQRVAANELRLHGVSGTVRDVISGDDLAAHDDLSLAPYQSVWLRAQDNREAHV